MAVPISDSVAFNALLEESLDNVYVVDADLRYARVSRGGALTVGLKPEQMIGRTWRELGFPAAVMEPIEAEWRHVLATGATVRRQIVFHGRHHEYVAFPLRTDDHIAGVTVVSRDVTDRVTAEQNALRAGERYRSFVANSSEAIWRFEIDEPIDTALPEDEQIDLAFSRGYLAECNDVMARMYGFESAEQITGARLPDMLDPSQEHNREFLRAFVRGGYRLTDAESIESDRFGNRKYFVNSFIGIVENEKLVRAWGTQRDITEQKTVLDAVQLSEQRLQALVAASAEVVWTSDPSGALKTITPSWTELTGQSGDEALGFGWVAAIHAEDRGTMTRLWKEAIANRARYRNVVRIHTRERGHRYFEIRSVPVLEADGAIREWVGWCADVDAQRRHEAALAEERTRALDANRAKDEFLATLSHELRTPLTSILGWAHLVRLSNYDMETMRTAVETVERSARTQAALIDDLLDVSRIVTGKFRLALAGVDVVPIVRDVVASSRPAAESKRVEITLDAPPSLVIRADANRLQQIVWNLVSNAVKFGVPDGRIAVEVEAAGERVLIRVRDNGIGIAPDVLPRVFDRFWQAESAPHRAHGGLGLGLAIVKQIAELHGGSVSAESEGLGRGATFTITLPKLAPNATPKRVLVVDDDADTRAAVHRTLELYGASVTAAGSADEALALLERGAYDLVLTDIAMPGHDGYWLLSEIRRRKPDARVAALTALGHSDDQIESAGFNSFIRKPVEPGELAALLR
jgi:PAS domain S-box-containing protein